MSTPCIILPRITLASHRCFRDEADLRLRPLTLLYGRNQAGKSTLLRLLPLLGDSLQSRTGPLDMTSPALRGATFKELGWLGPRPELTQRFGFHACGEGGLESTIRVDIVDDGRGPIVNRISASRGGVEVFDVALDARPAEGRLSTRYQGRCDGAAWSGEIDIPCLLPKTLPAGAAEILSGVRSATDALQGVQWLHAHRLVGGREASSRATRFCAPNGADLPVVLQRFPEAVARASEWLSRPEVGLGQLQLGQDTEGAPRFEVRPHPDWGFMPLGTAGEGLRALLPILLCACWAEGGGDNTPTVLVMEEPESQLHPHLQVALARRLTESVGRGVPVVAETHSVHVLRAVQLGVLEGRIQPKDIALYWVDQSIEGATSLRAIDVGSDATLQGWPPGVFEEEQALAREILAVRWAREDGP